MDTLLKCLGLSILASHVSASLVHHSSRSILPGLHLFPDSSSFVLEDNIVGTDFYSRFTWQTFDDPTHGRVDYVDLPTAQKNNLTSALNSFIMRADDTNIVPPNARGRQSNRITSNAAYTDSVLVLDVKHMPWGCGTWPAFWTVTTHDWPNGGEIDIIEGVNNEQANRASLHTTGGCRMQENREQTGSTVSTDCVAYDNNNEGCGTSFRNSAAYGETFNAMGGGWYVMKRTQSDGVYVWFFGRNDPSVPPEIRMGHEKIAPDDSWGIPDARFPSNNNCDFASHFGEHTITFDTTFCGDWAGYTFSQTCSQGTCQDFVDNNPSAFQEAYWEINALRVYVPSGPVVVRA